MALSLFSKLKILQTKRYIQNNEENIKGSQYMPVCLFCCCLFLFYFCCLVLLLYVFIYILFVVLGDWVYFILFCLERDVAPL